MNSSTAFVMQIADICIEICGFNDEDSACLNDLKRLFGQHEVSRDTTTTHRIVIYASGRIEIPPEATLRWESTCVGVAGTKPRRHRFFFVRKKEIPQYSGTGGVICYEDTLRQVEYFIPKNAEWRIEHVAKEHVTYVYPDRHNKLSEDLPSMLLHIIGSQYGYYLLYASCIAIDGNAFLFMGNSGVGKSTLCMELIKQGATYIGDDQVLVYWKGEQAMVGSLLFPVKCYADRLHTHKKKVDVVSPSTQHPPMYVPLKSIHLLQRAESANAESYLKPMQSEKMFEKMLTMTNKVNTYPDGHHFVNTISSICGSIPCYYFFYGDCTKINLSFFATHD